MRCYAIFRCGFEIKSRPLYYINIKFVGLAMQTKRNHKENAPESHHLTAHFVCNFFFIFLTLYFISFGRGFNLLIFIIVFAHTHFCI